MKHLDQDLIISLVNEILQEDPIDFSSAPGINPAEATRLVVLNMLEFYDELKSVTSQQMVDAGIIAMLSKLSLENFVLHTEKIVEGRW